jgi:hypothetical protein
VKPQLPLFKRHFNLCQSSKNHKTTASDWCAKSCAFLSSRKLERKENMNIGNLIRNLILIGVMLGAAGTLSEVNRQLCAKSAQTSARGLLSLSKLNRTLVGRTK